MKNVMISLLLCGSLSVFAASNIKLISSDSMDNKNVVAIKIMAETLKECEFKLTKITQTLEKANKVILGSEEGCYEEFNIFVKKGSGELIKANYAGEIRYIKY